LSAEHGHSHGPASYTRAFAIGITVNLAFAAAEAVYGLRANSLALLADAGHNFTDVKICFWRGRPPCWQRDYPQFGGRMVSVASRFSQPLRTGSCS